MTHQKFSAFNYTKSVLKLVAITAACGYLAACSTPAVVPVKPVDPIKTSLNKALMDVDTMPAHSASADAKAAPAKLTGGRITIRNYVGDASSLLSRIAKARGLQFQVNGPEPRLPLLVTVDVESVTFEDFLSQVGYQFGQRADLALADQRLEIRYRGQP